MMRDDTPQPLVSCIMPTYNRHEFVPHAIRYFLHQDFAKKELIIIDDGSDTVKDLVPDDERIRYLRLDKKHTIGAKRNLACKEAAGDIIVHWDDDDWMAPHRITYQVENLLKEQADVCGLDQLYFYDPLRQKAWHYAYPKEWKPWLAGGTLCYKKNFWHRNPFPDINVGEDARFVWSNLSKKITALRDSTFYVALIHEGNTSPKQVKHNKWHPHPVENIQHLMGEDLAFYQSLLNPNSSVRVETSNDMHIPTYSIIMVVHNSLEMVKMSTIRTLRHSVGYDARQVLVDNASDDGTGEWLDLLAGRGDIQLIRSKRNIGHGPGIELARRSISSPYIVTLDSDAFPLSDDWLAQLRA